MSINQFPGGIVTKNPTAPTTASAKGIWTLSQATSYAKQGIWPRIPSAPTIGTATAGNSSCASVTFTAPTCVGAGALTYSVVSTPGCISNTGASSPIVVSGLTGATSYTFKVYGVTPGGTGPGSAASNSITAVAGGSQTYAGPGTYSWVAPAGVTSVSVVAVGAGGNGSTTEWNPCCGIGPYSGGGGGGGGLGYRNNISVTPGNSYTVVIASGCQGTSVSSYFCSPTLVKGGNGGVTGNHNAGSGGSYVGTGGGRGGRGGSGSTSGYSRGGGGGGAGGYKNGVCNLLGGNGQDWNGGISSAGTCGAGGGGGRGTNCCTGGAGGGGVGLLGQGANGSAGSNGTGGGGGSGGSNGVNSVTNNRNAGAGGPNYGGGGGGGAIGGPYTAGAGGSGGYGAVRIIWPGTTRQFPSTCTSSP